MQSLYKTIEVAAPSQATVFISGDSGTGKELCAQAIHRRSPRARKPLISLNCSAIPRDLIESEIFGHVRGAFTGAVSDRDGAAILADGGTLFLDEICEMDLALQSKLLRFIQTSTVQRVGESRSRKVDIRFICATNRDIRREVAQGRFREDLYYRLHVIPVRMPPLRERDGDIRLLAEAFLSRHAAREGKTFSGFDASALRMLEAYDWPGNVRQLENLVHSIVVMNPGGEVTAAMVPLAFSKSARQPGQQVGGAPYAVLPFQPKAATHVQAPVLAQAGASRSDIRPLWTVEREAIEQAVDACDGNTILAAALLQISPSTIYRKRKAWAEMEATRRQNAAHAC